MRILKSLLLSFIALLAACQPSPSFKAVDITGAPYARELALSDHNGVKRTLADFRGKVVVVFFGFTQCPDVCPTTMADLAEVRKRLGKQGEQVQVLFVTIDPERDTPALLARYVPAFDPSFLGLVGDAAQTAATAKEFKVFYAKAPSRTSDSYTMDHTAGSYVFDREGKVRLFVRHAASVEDIEHDLRRLL